MNNEVNKSFFKLRTLAEDKLFWDQMKYWFNLFELKENRKELAKKWTM